jgi:hypothetical protein
MARYLHGHNGATIARLKAELHEANPGANVQVQQALFNYFHVVRINCAQSSVIRRLSAVSSSSTSTLSLCSRRTRRCCVIAAGLA